MSTPTLSAKDLRLRESVVRQLDWDPQVDAGAVGVAVDDGAVTLTGFIDSCSGKLAAERAVKRVHGVRAVANDLEVRPVLDRTDTDIAVDAVRALRARDNVPEGVQLAVHGGHVSLTGSVRWLFQKAAAEEAIRHVRGVRHIANHIAVSPESFTEDVKHRIVKALHHDADIDARHIRVEVSDQVATLTGSVASWLQSESAERAAANAPGIRHVLNHISVISPTHDDADEMC